MRNQPKNHFSQWKIVSDVLLVQNTRIEGSGYLGDLLQNDGFEITSVNAKHEQLPEKD